MSAPSLPPIVEAMMNPTFYGLSPEQKVELIQTHISYVFITNEKVYKLKKALNLEFLDFSTLELRKKYCFEELKLNQEFSPEIYQQVTSISFNDSKYLLDSPQGEIVDYCVVMNKLDRDSEFNKLLINNKLDHKTFEQLGREIAKTHLNAKTINIDTPAGTTELISSVAEDNFKITEKFFETISLKNDIAQFKAQILNFIDNNKNLFETRKSEGYIKACHGDMHLRNIALYKGQPVLFDCIEFSTKYSHIDVAYDIAFLLMDLYFNNKEEYASTVLNTWVEQTGDYSCLELMPFYMSMRAMVRAKVTSLQLADEAISFEEKQKARELALEYYKLAKKLFNTSKGKIFITCGLSGSGKSTISKLISKVNNAVIIRTDALRKHITNTPLQQKGQGIYTSEISEQTYSKLFELGNQLSNAGFNVILDGTFLTAEQRANAFEKLHTGKENTVVVHCHAPIEKLKEWINSRTNDVSDATVEVLEKQIEIFEEPKGGKILSINTENEITTEQLNNILSVFC